MCVGVGWVRATSGGALSATVWDARPCGELTVEMWKSGRYSRIHLESWKCIVEGSRVCDGS